MDIESGNCFSVGTSLCILNVLETQRTKTQRYVLKLAKGQQLQQ